MELVAALSITLALVSIIMCLGMASQLDGLRREVESLNKHGVQPVCHAAQGARGQGLL